MLASYPAQVLDEVVVVLNLELVGGRGWAKLESGSQEGEFVDALGEVIGGSVNVGVCDRYRVDVDAAVVDANESKAEVIDQGGRKHVSFGDTEKSIVDRDRIGEIEIGWTRGSAERRLQSARAKRHIPLRVGEEEAGGKPVGGIAKIMIPVGGELVVHELAGLADGELD